LPGFDAELTDFPDVEISVSLCEIAVAEIVSTHIAYSNVTDLTVADILTACLQ